MKLYFEQIAEAIKNESKLPHDYVASFEKDGRILIIRPGAYGLCRLAPGQFYSF